MSTLSLQSYLIEDSNDRELQFHPLTFGDHTMNCIWNFLNNEISVGLMNMIFKFLKVDRGEFTIGKQSSTTLKSGQSIGQD